MRITKMSVCSLFLLLLSVHKVKATVANHRSTIDSSSHKRTFLSPRDLNGSYSRFLEVSGNSTLCPNTISHNTNGVLYPNGFVHIPFSGISHDKQRCAALGEIVLRFRRTMESGEIEKEFDITANAIGIDKFVRDILLDLNAFYFGRQTRSRQCHSSSLPSEAAFFFTSQQEPFAAKVGDAFQKNPKNQKIMLVVDKSRVCAFSASFSQPVPILMTPEAIPKASIKPTPHIEQIESDANSFTAPTISPRNLLESEEMPLQQKADGKKRQPGLLESPATASEISTVASPRMGKDDTVDEAKLSGSEGENMKNATSTPTAQSGSQINSGNLHVDQQRHKGPTPNSEEKLVSSSPVPTQKPQPSIEETLSPPEKYTEESKTASSSQKPSTMKPVKTGVPIESFSNNPTSKHQDVMLPSVSPFRNENKSASTNFNASRPQPVNVTFIEGNIPPSPSPTHINSEEIHSYPHSGEELQAWSPLVFMTTEPEPAEWEAIIGDSDSTCFPSNALVKLSGGSYLEMGKLTVGHSVSVGDGRSSKVIDFSHSDRTLVASFLQFQTKSGNNLTLTPPHYVYTERGLLPASQVMFGDFLKLSDGGFSRVVNIIKVKSRGLFNPHTLQGDIVVDGFVVSTYTLAAAPMVAHALLAPIRLLYGWGFKTAILLKLSLQKNSVKTFSSFFSQKTPLSAIF